MRSSKQIRLLFILTGIILIAVIATAVLRGSGQGDSDLQGTWQIIKIGPNKVAGAAAEGQQIELHSDGTFIWPAFQSSGKWAVSGAVITLTTEKYNGKTKAEFLAESQAKYPGDSSMQKIAEKVFEELKLTVKPDHSEIAIEFGGASQVYRKKGLHAPQ